MFLYLLLSNSDEAFDEAKSIDTKPEPTGNTAPTEIVSFAGPTCILFSV